MHTESAYDGWTACCYPEQGMVDRLLRVHIQSQQAFGPWWTLSYNNMHTMHAWLTVQMLWQMHGRTLRAVHMLIVCMGIF